MDSETMGELARLEAEIEQLRAMVWEQGEAAAQEGGAGGDGFGTPITPVGGEQGAFRWEGDKITHCNFYAAHGVVELADVAVGQGQADGTWYLNVDHADLGAATVSKTAGPNDDDHTSVKLFTISNGDVSKDYRGMPFIPIYA